jgi:hypothetical protein
MAALLETTLSLSGSILRFLQYLTLRKTHLEACAMEDGGMFWESAAWIEAISNLMKDHHEHLLICA